MVDAQAVKGGELEVVERQDESLWRGLPVLNVHVLKVEQERLKGEQDARALGVVEVNVLKWCDEVLRGECGERGVNARAAYDVPVWCKWLIEGFHEPWVWGVSEFSRPVCQVGQQVVCDLFQVGFRERIQVVANQVPV